MTLVCSNIIITSDNSIKGKRYFAEVLAMLSLLKRTRKYADTPRKIIIVMVLGCFVFSVAVFGTTTTTITATPAYFPFFLNVDRGSDSFKLIKGNDQEGSLIITQAENNGTITASVSSGGTLYDIATLYLTTYSPGLKKFRFKQTYGSLYQSTDSSILYTLYYRDATHSEGVSMSNSSKSYFLSKNISSSGVDIEVLKLAIKVDAGSFASALEGNYSDTITVEMESI